MDEVGFKAGFYVGSLVSIILFLLFFWERIFP